MKLTYDYLRDIDSDIRAHSDGFIQLTLDQECHYRLHIRDDSIKGRLVDMKVHNHMYDIHSKVIFGELTHRVFDLSEEVSGDYYLYKVMRSKETSNCILQKQEGIKGSFSLEKRVYI